jgi:mono/diheme cytochrome c family protein
MKMIKHTLAAAVLAAMSCSAWAADSADQQLIKQGEYLSRASDCVACHTATGGKPYAGGLGLASPLGTIYSTNITPSKSTGIGDYSLQEFDRAVRHGVARDGHTLYPAMPYTSFARMSPDDVKALYAYFMNGVAPVDQANKPTDISWPLSMRWPLSIWRLMFAPKPVDGVAPAGGEGQAELLRGKYLVEGPGHCSACHTARGWALQEKALTDVDGPAFLGGGEIDGWVAKSLRGDAVDGLGSWSKADLVAFLKTGRNAHTAAFGSMADVVEQSTQYMTDADLNAIAAYLKSLAPAGASQALVYDPAAAQSLRGGTDKSSGAMTFLDNCAACHRSTGKGYEETFPGLALNPVLNTADPASVIHIILKGATVPGTAAAPTAYTMPGFDWRLTDQEVADVATFVRGSWGNKGAAVTAADVAKARKNLGAAAAPVR